MTEFPAAVYDLPKDIRAKLRDYPQTLQQLALVYYQPRLPDGYYPHIVSIYCDERLGVQAVDNKKTWELEVEQHYFPKLIEFNFDGQMVALLLVGEGGEKEILLDRMPLKSDFYPFKQQGIPQGAGGRSGNTRRIAEVGNRELGIGNREIFNPENRGPTPDSPLPTSCKKDFGKRLTDREVLVFDVAELEEWGKMGEGML